MLTAVALLIIYGCVLSAHGCIYIDNANLKLISVHPNISEMTDALRLGGNYLGISVSGSCNTAEIVLIFNKTGNILIYKALDPIKNPLKIEIYISKSGKTWKFVREDVAGEGVHSVLLPFSPKYVMIKAIGSARGGFGATLFDAIYLKRQNKIFTLNYKFSNGYMYVYDIWVPYPLLITFYLATFIGSSAFLNDRKLSFILSILATTLLILVNLIFNIKIFLISNIYLLTLFFFMCGVLIGFIFNVFIHKTEHTND